MRAAHGDIGWPVAAKRGDGGRGSRQDGAMNLGHVWSLKTRTSERSPTPKKLTSGSSGAERITGMSLIHRGTMYLVIGILCLC